MVAGFAHAPAVRGTPPTAIVIDPRPCTFLHERRLAARGSGILIQRAPAGTGQPQR
jgi:hypothetical protein